MEVVVFYREEKNFYVHTRYIHKRYTLGISLLDSLNINSRDMQFVD